MSEEFDTNSAIDFLECISGGPLEANLPKQEYGPPHWSERSVINESLHRGFVEWLHRDLPLQDSREDEDQEHSLRLMGYIGVLDAERATGSEDELLVEIDSLSIDNGVVRGLIFNPSATRFARNTTVTLASTGPSTTVSSWKWPLTIQPGERAPFELHVLDDQADIGDLQFEVSADYSNCGDLSRSFKTWFNIQGTIASPPYQPGIATRIWGPYLGSNWDDLITYGTIPHNLGFWPIGFTHWGSGYTGLQHPQPPYPDFILEVPQPDSRVSSFYEIYASLQAPDSHFNLDNAIVNYSIDDLQIYVAIFDGEGKVKEIKRLPPFTVTDYRADGSREFAPSDSIPNANPEYPRSVHALVTIPGRLDLVDETFQVWIGGANGS